MEPVSSLHSHLPWFEVFYKILNTVGDLLAQDQVRPALLSCPSCPQPCCEIPSQI
jgi:hypothetical protein